MSSVNGTCPDQPRSGPGSPKCLKNAKFMANLSRGETEGVFWAMTFCIIICAMSAAVIYSNTEREYRIFKKQEQCFKELLNPTPEEEKQHEENVKRFKRRAILCLLKTSALLIIVIACAVFQAISIFAIQHCHNEDLLPLYWPVWTLIGLGSTIAMIGVCINQVYGLLEQDLPPFGTALGTPVLVVCSIGHLIYQWSKHKWTTSNRDSTVVLEKAPTMGSNRSGACNSMVLSPKNGPILQIWDSDEPHPPTAAIIGKSSAGYTIIEHRCLSERSSGHCNSCSRRSSGPGSPSGVQLETVPNPSV